MPDVTVPVATHTGFNPRHPDTGGGTHLLEYLGSSLLRPVTTLAASTPPPLECKEGVPT